jgi:hypothetical protein
VYLRKLRQGVYHNKVKCEILQWRLSVCSTDQAAGRTEESLARS